VQSDGQLDRGGSLTSPIITDRVNREDRATGSIRLSVCLSVRRSVRPYTFEPTEL